MKRIDPHSDLQDGFELAPPPPIGPDGAPQLQPQRSDPPARPSLCRAGPCRHYHRLVTQVDAENPRAVRLPIVSSQGGGGMPQGAVYRAPAVFHVETHHYCYPDVGIEMPLGALPVVECNRWMPSEWPPLAPVRVLATKRASVDQYDRDLAAWESARAREVTEAAETEQLIAQSMALTPSLIACQVCGKGFEESDLDIEMRCPTCRSHFPSLNPRIPNAKETP